MAEVLVIKGDWGTGKTYLWNELVRGASKNSDIPCDKYCYMSLFGIADLQHLKNNIFDESIDVGLIEEGVSLKTLRKNAVEVLGDKRLSEKIDDLYQTSKDWLFQQSKHLEKIPYIKDYSPLFRSAAYQLVRNTLICFDDIERKGKSLELSDVFGLISTLKEQRNCKIVIILNKSELDDSSKETFKQYREKVIDIELSFSPSVDDALMLYNVSRNNLDSELVENIKKLDINNIRIIDKINKQWLKIESLFASVHKGVIKQAKHSLVLLAWCLYSKKPKVPDFDFVTKIGSTYSLYMNDADMKEDEKKWVGFLQEYSYQHTDAMDRVLIEYLKNGYINKAELKKEAEIINERLKIGDGKDQYHDVWKLYHDSFSVEEKEFLHELKDKFIKNIKYLSLSDLNSVVRIFREIGDDNKAEMLVDTYIKKNIDKTEAFDLEKNTFPGDINDKYIVEKFDAHFIASTPKLSLKETVESMAGNNGWSKKDEDTLIAATANDFYKLFKEIEGENLSGCVKACLPFGRFASPTKPEHEKISGNTTAALKKIASESTLNWLRVKKFGIEVKKNKKKSNKKTSKKKVGKKKARKNSNAT